MIILDLCGGSGAWSAPYRTSGHIVVVVDPAATVSDDQHTVFLTVREFLQDTRPFIDRRVHGIIAAPPCTEFAGSGARWWKNKPISRLTEAVSVVHDCLRCVEVFNPHWWVLENPVGRLATCVPELGPCRETYQPLDYGDPWTKRTCLWGNFNMPEKHPILRDPDPRKGQPVWYASPSPERTRLRSITPPGFAQAFYRANP